MSKSATVIFVFLVLASCSLAGCSSLPFSGPSTPAQTSQQVTGIPSPASGVPRDATRSATTGRLELNSTLHQMLTTDVFQDEDKIVANETADRTLPEKKIKAIRGRDLDENGNARSWTFVVEHGNLYSIVTYSGTGMQVSDSQGTLKQATIDTMKILSPRELFDRNRAVITNTTRTGTTLTRDLSIGEGRATLTITGNGAPRILVFDATTGVLKSSND